MSCCRTMAVVVNVMAKGATRSRQVWTRETSASEPPGKPRKMALDGTETGVPTLLRERVSRRPDYWRCGVRGIGGVTLALALVRNLRTWLTVLREKAQAEDP